MKILRAVIWVCLVLAFAVTLAAQNPFEAYFNPANPSVSSTGPDTANALSPGWNPPPTDLTHHPMAGWVQTWATCSVVFYYQASTNRTFPVSVGMAARQYSSCRANFMQLTTDDMSINYPYEWVIRGNNVNFNPLTGTTYEWGADSRCGLVDPDRPWNARIVETREVNNGC